MKLLASTSLILFLMLLFCQAGCKQSETEKAADNAYDREESANELTELGNFDKQKWGGLEVAKAGKDLKDAEFIVVFLHGLGANAGDMVLLCQNLSFGDSTSFVFPNGPFRARNNGRAWMVKRGDFEAAREKIVSLLTFIQSENPTAKVILGGYSQGAIMASNLISDKPQSLEGVILLAPSGQLRYQPDCDADNKPQIFLAHGREDRVLPFEGSDQLRKKLIALNYEVDWFAYDGGHRLPPTLPVRLNAFIKRVQEE